MREELDETKVTAYALGTLEDEERAAVEASLAVSEDARREVEEIRATVAALREAFESAPRHELTAAQRQALEVAAVAPAAAPVRRASRSPRSWGMFAAAAALVAAATLIPYRLARVAPPGAVPVPARPQRLPALAAPNAETMARPIPVPAQAQQSPTVAVPSAQERQTLQSLGYLHGYNGRVTLRFDVNAARYTRAPLTVTLADSAGTATFHAYDRASRGDVGYLSATPEAAESNGEAYAYVPENPFVLVAQDPRSTFSVDVDTASYAIVRRYLNGGQLPPADAVRIEELVNYFPYDYDPPLDGRPFAAYLDAAACPWNAGHRLVRVALKGREVPRAERPPSNLVFLLDVSGSMDAPNKLPLVKAAMRLLVNELGPLDRVAIVVYAGTEGLALPSTPASDKAAILGAIETLAPYGSTNGSGGIRLAYETAKANLISGGVNRVVLATDGDFNVGVTSEGELVRLIERHAKSGVFLTTLGFGMGNLKDATLEKLADHGNGNYAYVDSLAEARKVLVEQAGGTLVTIAKDVKLQVEWNPRQVQAFRLVGYENRVLAHQDFNDDKRDAGDIGAGHTVTALYEVVPPGVEVATPAADELKYQRPATPGASSSSGELLTLKLRYKQPDEERSALMEIALRDDGKSFDEASPEFRFAASVAAFGMVLRDSPHKGASDLRGVAAWAGASRGADPNGLRAEFVELVGKASALRGR